MSEKKIRNYPPIIVTLATIALTLFLGVQVVGREAATARQSQDVENTYAAEHVAQAPQTLVQQSPQPAVVITPAPTATATEPPTAATNESLIGSRDWDAEDAEILLQIAMAEAEGESVEGKALVMLVVLNRVWSDNFPNTIEDVVFAKRQFSVTVEGGRYWTVEPDEGCREALKLVASGWDESEGALYFESCKNDSWHSRNLEFLFQAGNHRFYR